jgi:hypothetical protein
MQVIVQFEVHKNEKLDHFAVEKEKNGITISIA